MTDINAPNTKKNNTTICTPLSEKNNVCEKNLLFKNNGSEISSAKASYSNFDAEYVSQETDMYASTMSGEEVLCDDFNLHFADSPAILDSKLNQCLLVQNNDRSTAHLDKALFNIPSSTPQLSDYSSSKFNLGNKSILSTKTKNTSNFPIISQFLNKRQNIPFAKAGTSSNCSSPQNFKQVSPPHHDEASSCSELNEGAQPAHMKTKLKSMWNNMKYGWRMKREVNLKTDSAIWLLGQCYHNKLNDSVTITQDVAEQLKQDLLSKIWLTYRINFPAIPGTNLVSDSGWGCMLRSGQMMMAQAFVCHFLQRNWRLSYDQSKDTSQLYKTILRWFGDSLSEKSPFSLHRLVSLGENYGRKAGDWYGPTHAAHVLRDALLEAKKHHSLLQHLCMYVASDGIVFKQDVIDLFVESTSQDENSISSLGSNFENISLTEVQDSSCHEGLKENSSNNFTSINTFTEEEVDEGFKSFENPCPSYSEYGPPSYNTVKHSSKSLVLFVSVRLGNDKINPFYIPCLKSLLAYEHCIGIIGGRPKHALYFIGWQDDKIIHLDPHSCQPAIDVEKEFCEKSFHSASIRTMSFNEMDPSCAIGFYFRELEEFQLFVERFSEITAPLKRNLEYPVFALAEGKRVEIEDDTRYLNEKCIYTPISSSCCDADDDDYILL